MIGELRPPKMSLSLDKRYEIVFLYTHSKGPKLSLRETAKQIRCAEKTVRYWVRRWGESKDLSDKPKSGRRRITTAKQDAMIIDFAEKKNETTVAEIQQEMRKKHVEVSEITIRRRLHENGGKFFAKLSKPLLTDRHRTNRLKWAKKYKNYDWNKVIFSDESTFHLNQGPKKTWQFPGKRKVFRSVKHPLKLHIWGCFSASGFGELVYFYQNLDAELMVKVYKVGLRPSANKLFGNGSIGWVLQEDNDPKHRSNLVKRWKQENSIEVLPWPAMSPDQNPIENVWAIMKLNLAKKKIRNLKGLVREIGNEWNHFENDLAVRLVNSMKNRIAALIEAEGDYTMY